MQYFREPDPFLGSLVIASPPPKTLPFSPGAALKLLGSGMPPARLCRSLSLSPCFSLSLPLVSCSLCHAEKLSSLSSPAAVFILVPPTGTFLTSFCRAKGEKKPDGGTEQAPRGARGAAVLSFPELGFYSRRCIPWEGGCVCAGAFPHSGQLLFNGGLHAGQTPEEILLFPVPIQKQQQLALQTPAWTAWSR